MARIFITGSSQGLGLMAAQLLIAQGHAVVLHARDSARADAASRDAPGAAGTLVGDLLSLDGTKRLAEAANALGRFDAVIHNAGVGYREPAHRTHEELPHVFAVNVLAPYVLTAAMTRPQRLVYLSSGMHHGVEPDLDDITWTKRRWVGSSAYAESKFYDTALAFAVARLWPGVRANAVDPGWVATRMGGAGASGDLGQGHLTQAWLATGDDAPASGEFFFHKTPRAPNARTCDPVVQERLLAECARLSGLDLPDA